MKKAPISAVIASRNEGNLLPDCLKSVLFCDEIIVYDLESSDDTVGIARQHGATLISHPVVPVVEEVRAKAIAECKYRWILFIDPDERISQSLAGILAGFADSHPENCGIAAAPWIFYFKRKRLKGTMWGVQRNKAILFNRDGVTFTPHVHFGSTLKKGFIECSVGDFETANITHYWSDSFGSLISKHRRYVSKEGASKYQNGDRYPGVYKHIRTSLTAFYSCFFYYRGYKDGLNGLFLSLFWAWYTFASLKSLLRYQNSQ